MYIKVYFSPGLLVPYDHIHDTKNIKLANVLKCTAFDPVTYNSSTAGIGRTHAGFKNERIPTDAIVVIDK